MTRIAFIVGDMTVGGVASATLNYFRYLSNQGLQFDFYSYAPSAHDEEIRSLGGRVFYTKSFKNPFAATKALEKMLREGQYDIAHAHLNTLNFFALKAAKRVGVPVRIAHNHSTSAPLEAKTLIKLILRPMVLKVATHLAACSASSAAWAYGKHAQSAMVLNNAIDLGKFCFDPAARELLRRQLGLDDKLVVGHVGRFVYQKNHTFLINQMASLAKSNDNAVLVLVGSGKLEGKIKRQVKRKGLSQRVIFLGERQDVAALYSAFDLLVLPSHYEGLPLVAIEAQCAGLRVLLSDKITKDAAIINAKLLPLSMDWAGEMQRAFRLLGERRSQYQALKNFGFDIRAEAQKLAEYYLQCTHNQSIEGMR